MAKEIFTTYEVSGFCHVDLSTVTNWIDDGKLPAYKTPGGHRRIRKADLLLFLESYRMPVPQELRPQSPRILIVDDEKHIVDLLRRVLRKTGWKLEIETASDGFEAGRKVASFRPDLVVLDLYLPGVDGFKVCRSIRENSETGFIRIIAITGANTEENKQKILSCGADTFLSKPFDIGEFTARAAQLLGIVSPGETHGKNV